MRNHRYQKGGMILEYLLQITLGPVQDFIMTARRTRDLWFGSYLLSECSKAVAKSISDKGKLIFPNPSDKNLLERTSFFRTIPSEQIMVWSTDLINKPLIKLKNNIYISTAKQIFKSTYS